MGIRHSNEFGKIRFQDVIDFEEATMLNFNVTFPENITDFLTWIKMTTEAAWNKASEGDFLYGAKWLPLSEQEIDSLEMKYSIKFGSEHRAFLRILHTMNKRDLAYDEMMGSDDDSEVKRYGQPSYFYNWLTDIKWIESRLTWPQIGFVCLRIRYYCSRMELTPLSHARICT